MGVAWGRGQRIWYRRAIKRLYLSFWAAWSISLFGSPRFFTPLRSGQNDMNSRGLLAATAPEANGCPPGFTLTNWPNLLMITISLVVKW